MTTIYESEIEHVTLELLRDEGGGRGVWLLGRTAIGAYIHGGVWPYAPTCPSPGICEGLLSMNPINHQTPNFHHRRSIRLKEYDYAVRAYGIRPNPCVHLPVSVNKIFAMNPINQKTPNFHHRHSIRLKEYDHAVRAYVHTPQPMRPSPGICK